MFEFKKGLSQKLEEEGHAVISESASKTTSTWL